VAQTTLPLTETCGVNLFETPKASGGGGGTLPPLLAADEEFGVPAPDITKAKNIHNRDVSIKIYFNFYWIIVNNYPIKIGRKI
jgi:hypothetical protein